MLKSFGTFLLYIVLPATLLVMLFWFGWGNGLKSSHSLVVKEVYGGAIGLISGQSSPLEKDFTIINKGQADVTIGRVYTDCTCLTVIITSGTSGYNALSPNSKEDLGPFSTPIEANTKPLGINIPPQGEMLLRLTFGPGDAPNLNFSGNIFVETLKAGEILKIPITANIVK